MTGEVLESVVVPEDTPDPVQDGRDPDWNSGEVGCLIQEWTEIPSGSWPVK